MTVQVTVLPNGLRVATDTMDAVGTATLGVWVGAGARHESAADNGAAHFVEHMLFKGTERRGAFEISEAIEAVGGQLNAHTTREYTAFHAKVLSENTGLALDVISDMIQNSLLDSTDLDRERSVIIQEMGMCDDTPEDVVFDLFARQAYPNQALGRTILGEEAVISSMPRDRLAAWLGDTYRAGNMVVVGAGRINHDWLVEESARLFTKLPSGLPIIQVEPARYVGGDERSDRDLEQLHLVMGFPATGLNHPDEYAFSMLASILGGGASSRLFQEVREKRGLVYSIYAFTNAYSDSGLFGIYAGFSPDKATELVPIVTDLLHKVADDVTEEEMNRSRMQMKAGLVMSQESTMSRAEQLGHQLLAFGRPIPISEVLERITAVDLAQVRRVAREMVFGELTLAAVGPVFGLGSLEHVQACLKI